MPDLTTARARKRLRVRRDPYYHRLAEGAYLGFRRGPDTWTARYRGPDGEQNYTALKEVPSGDYDAAVKAAMSWFAQLGGTAVRSPQRGTVGAALEAYLVDLERHGRTDAARTARSQFRTAVLDDPLAGRPLEACTRDDFEEWRDRLRPGRRRRSVNRYTTQVAAALNVAHALGHVGNPAAWRLKSLMDDGAEHPVEFLGAAQRKAIIAAAAPNAGLFFRGLELTGARPSELASTTVQDFDGRSVRLASRKGRGGKVRERYTVLDQDGVTFFTAQVAGKLPRASIFTEDGELAWRRDSWAEQMRDAIKGVNAKARAAARIPLTASAYSFRHARASELLQLHGIDPISVAMQLGTSTVMLERTYAKFIQSAFIAKLAAIKAAS